MFSLMFLLVGCTAIADLKDDVQGATSPLVLEGLVLGIAPPTSAEVDLTGTAFEDGAAAVATIADASSVDGLDEAPIEGAEVALLLESGGRVVMVDEGGGRYTCTAADGLTYTDGDSATLSVDYPGEDTTSSAQVQLPRAPTVSFPASVPRGQPLHVDLAGQSFDNALVVVVDAATGETSWSNYPTTIEDMYNLTHGSGSLTVDVPGTALAEESIYLVGVAGLVNAEQDSLTNLNTLLSALTAGRLVFSAVSTVPP